MDTMTEKQATYRQGLIDQWIQDAAKSYTTYKAGRREQYLVSIALLRSLPVPVTSAEANEQISDLKGGGVMMYARRHQDWAQPVLDALTAAWGTEATQWPSVTRPDGAIPTTADIVDLVQGVAA